MMELTLAALAISATAGLLSFLSPCVLPLVPAYLSFVTGMSLDELAERDRARRRTVLTHAALFVGGFSLVFVLLGASATFLGAALGYYGRWLEIAGGVLVIGFGLYMVGVLRLPGAEREWRVHLAEKPLGYFGTVMVGVTFGAGWTPCIGPVLGGILALAATADGVTSGMGLLGAYSLGLAVPFLLSAVALDRFLLGRQRMRRWLPWVNRIAGVLLVLIGVLLLSGAFSVLAESLARYTPDFILDRM
jgi:cytochrome c-type biogenesis protein